MLEFKTLQIKAEGQAGRFSGYGSTFGNRDRVSDVVERGAFTKSLARHLADDTLPALLWAHDQNEPVGKIMKAEEDSKGLLIEGQIATGTARGKDAYELLKLDALALSIGYRIAPGGQKSGPDGTRRLTEVDLSEVSLVALPANPQARVMHVKSMKASDVRKILCDHLQLSRAQAEAYASAGLKALTTLNDDEAAEAERLALRLKSITNLLKKGI